MSNRENNEPQAYALYSFIDEETAKSLGVKQYTLEPPLRLKLKALTNLIRLALKRYFNVDAPDGNLLKGGNRQCEGVYFSISMGERAVCVAVSKCPIGVGGQVPFDMANKEEYAERYFCESEIRECVEKSYDDETMFYIHSKKEAYRKKFNLSGDMKIIDTSKQDVYTLHKDTCSGVPYFFAATDDVKFVKIDIETILY